MRNKTVIGHLRFENYHLETTGFRSVVIQFQPKTQTQPSGVAERAAVSQTAHYAEVE